MDSMLSKEEFEDRKRVILNEKVEGLTDRSDCLMVRQREEHIGVRK